MKKYYFLIMGLLVALLLSACGTKVTKEDVIANAFKKSISSFDADMKTEIDINANGQKANQTMDIQIKYIEEPFITSMKVNSINGNVELYLDKESAYIQMPGTSEWFKTSINSVPEFKEMASGDSVKEDLEKIKKFSDVFNLEQEEEGYLLKVKLDEKSTEEEKDLVQEVLKDSLQQENVELSKIKNFDYVVKFDKDFLLKQIKTIADLQLKVDGESGDIKIKVQADYKDINAVKAFSVPQEVKDNAIEQGQ